MLLPDGPIDTTGPMKRDRLVVTLIVAASAGAILWLAWPRRALPQTNVGTAPPPASASAVRDSDVALDDPNVASRRAHVDPPPTTPATDVDPVPWFEIQVVDAATGAPAHDADVATFDMASFARLAPALQPEWQHSIHHHEERLAFEHGVQVPLDDDGVGRIRSGRGTRLVVARRGGAFARLALPIDAAPAPHRHTLALVPDRTLRVLVLDARGAPASGVPLAVERGGTAFESNVTAAPDGMATWPHVQEWLRRADTDRDAIWRVRTAIPHHDDVGVRFDPASLHVEPLVLHLPPTGVVEVRVVVAGRPHRPSRERATVMLETAGNRARSAPSIAWSELLDDDGVAQFPFVPIGRTFVVHTPMPARIERTFEGPQRHGQVVRVELAPQGGAIVLVGRLVDDAGRALARQRATVTGTVYRSKGGPLLSGGAVIRTDADGRFLWHVGTPAERHAELRRFDFAVERDDARPLIASVAPRRLEVGVNDLGDVTVRELEPVVAGRFVFAPGTAPRDVHFDVERSPPLSRRSTSEAWESCEGLTRHQAADGRFEVFGALIGGAFRIRIFESALVHPDAVPFTPGQRDLVIGIARATPLTVSLKLPPRFPWGVFARLVPTGAVPPSTSPPLHADVSGRLFAERELLERDDHQQMTLRWAGVPAGSYTFDVRLTGYAAPLVEVVGVELPGREGADPRLVGIDLRDRLGVVTVRATSRAAPVTQGPSLFAFPMPQPGSEHARDVTLCGYRSPHGDVVEVATMGRPVDLLVVQPGLSPQTVRDAFGEVAVALVPWPVVELRFVDLPALPEGVRLQVARGPGAESRPVDVAGLGRRGDLFAPGAETVPVVDGRARLTFGIKPARVLLTLIDASGRARDVRHSLPEIAPDASPVEVRIPRAAIDEALAR
jgi:hypothetical protein